MTRVRNLRSLDPMTTREPSEVFVSERRTLKRARVLPHVDDLCLSSVVLMPRIDSATLVEQALPNMVVLAHDRAEFESALQAVAAPSCVAMAVETDDLEHLTDRAMKRWPTAPCAWFSRFRAKPDVPSNLRRRFDIDTVGPLLSPGALVDDLVRRVHAGRERRLREIRDGQAFAQRHALGPVARLIPIHLALGITFKLSQHLIDRDDAEYSDLLRRQVYPHVGVDSRDALLRKLMEFVIRARECGASE